jgi:alpha-L-fucosidase
MMRNTVRYSPRFACHQKSSATPRANLAEKVKCVTVPIVTTLRLLSLASLLLGAACAQNFTDIRPSPQQVAWQDLEIGVLIHYGPNSFMDREWGDGKADPSVFNPPQLDAEQWIAAAQAAGARYVVMVTKHHDGFCLFPSRETKYSVASSPWRGGQGDLVREVAAAARKHGLKFGVYLSPWDRHEPAYADPKAYDKHYAHQLAELAQHYGELTEFWVDGAGSEGHVYDWDRYIETLRDFQPNTLLFSGTGFFQYGDIRWCGNERGWTYEDNWNVVDRHGYLRWRPQEVDFPLRDGHWFWHPNSERRLKSLDTLLDRYHRSVGYGAQMMLGLAPDNRGLLPDCDVARLREFGDAIRRLYSNDLARQGTRKGLEITFRQPVTFDRTVIMEQLYAGQHIHRYEIQAFTGGTWKTLKSARTIGHKKIDIFPRTTATAVRLRVLESSATPQIRGFQVFDGR